MDTTITSGQLQLLLKILKEKRMNPLLFNRILESGILSDVFDGYADLGDRNKVRVALGMESFVPEVFRLTVDYTKPFWRMVSECPHEYKHPDLTEDNFPICGEGVVTFEGCLIRFVSCTPTIDEVIRRIKLDEKKSWSPGRLEHLLRFGAMFPGAARRFPVAAPGSVRNVADIGKQVPEFDAGKLLVPSLGLATCAARQFGRAYRFLAVRRIA